MTVYVVNILLILFWGFILIYQDPSNKTNKLLFCFIASFQWILISGLRAPSVGADTSSYMNSYILAGQCSWSTILGAFKDVYFHGRVALNSGENFLYKDTGYLVFQKLMHIFTDNPQVYLFIVAIIVFGLLGYFIYQNSEDPVFSYILFSALFYSFYAITGIRQTLATALVVFLGFELIKKRKLVLFLLTALIAFTLHKSALVFIPFYFLSQIKITKKYIGEIIGITIIIWLIGPRFIIFMSNLLGYNKDDVFQLDTSGYASIMCIVGLGVALYFNRIQEKNESKKMALNATFYAASFATLTLLHQGMMRIQQYYALFLMLSIPDVIDCFEIKTRRLLRIGCICILILYLLRNNPHYQFFWQFNY